MCVNGTKKQSANTLANSCGNYRTYLYSRQHFHWHFRVVKTRIWRVNDLQTLVGNCQPTKTTRYINDGDLFSWHSTKWGTQVNTIKLIEEVHNCPAVRDASSIVYKDAENKQRNMEDLAGGQTGFRPNFSICPPLSVSSHLVTFVTSSFFVVFS